MVVHLVSLFLKVYYVHLLHAYIQSAALLPLMTD